MKVLKRVLIKSVILLFVIALAASGAVCLRGYRQSTAEYAINSYLEMLIDNNGEKAFTLLDQSEDQVLTKEEYLGALEAGKYSLYSSFNVKEAEKRRDNNGNEYTDYQVEFLDASGEVQKEEDFTAKKQAEAVFGIFDKWKIMSEHCMITNFSLTVPTGSEVYLNNEAADASWIVRDGIAASYDCYQIPSLVPGKYSLVVRHPALESVNTTLDSFDEAADYTSKMALKQSAQDECKEIAVKALKQLYSASASKKTDELKEMFADCLESAETLVKAQSKVFHKEDAVFKNVAVSGFAAQFGDPVFTDSENGAITTEMTFSYHYVLREDVTTDTGEYDEEGNSIQETETEETAGDVTAKFQMSFYDGQWHIAGFEMPAVPEKK